MKTIKVPADIVLKTITGQTIVDQDGKEQVATFKDFVYGRLVDPKMGKDMATILRVVKMKDSLDKMQDVLVLDDEDWRLLEAVVREPSPQATYNSAVAHCLVPFFTAITDAE